jgi:beta-lactamase superfamily II metal-dependent hydrolase
LIIGQIPHHGSKENYFDSLWKVISQKDGPFGCISVGDNSYGHPDPSVISSLNKLKYNVLQTFAPAIRYEETSHSLDLVSTIVASPVMTPPNDLFFDIDVHGGVTRL